MQQQEPKKVLAVVGSPRKKGNCDILCDRVLAGARSAGASVEKFYLYDMDIRPCRHCDGCREPERGICMIRDEMRPMYPKLKSCDALVIASPIYWMMVSGPTKIFLDRWYPLSIEDKNFLKARRAVCCLTYGADDVLLSGCDLAARAMNDVFAFLKIPVNFVHASAWRKGDILKNCAALKRAYDAGKEMVK
jgi:multimeric flavodoxin WrbA